MRAFVAAVITSAALLVETPADLRAFVRQSLAGLNHEDKVKSDWLYVSRAFRKEFNADGTLKLERSLARRHDFIDGEPIGRVFERDGKPLSAVEIDKQDAAIRKAVAEHKSLSVEQKRRRREAAQKKNAEADAWIQEFPEALDYTIAGEEAVNGRNAVVVEFRPRDGYQPRNMRARLFEKMRGKLWIDKADKEMTRADAEIFDTVSIGLGILGRIEKGTKFYLERRMIAPGVWLTETEQMRFDVRLMLVRSMKQEILNRYSEWVPKVQAQAQGASPAKPGLVR